MEPPDSKQSGSTRRRLSVGIVSVLILLMAAIGLLVLACSDGTRPATSAPGVPTSSIGRPSNTLQEALSQARFQFTASPPWVLHEIESVVYVETTAGKARDLLDPERTTPSDRWIAYAEDDAPCWVVVAYGRFQWKSMPGSATPGPTYTSVWVVVPTGEGQAEPVSTNDRYDASRLGRVVEVPVPLAPFPTPVRLNDTP